MIKTPMTMSTPFISVIPRAVAAPPGTATDTDLRLPPPGGPVQS